MASLLILHVRHPFLLFLCARRGIGRCVPEPDACIASSILELGGMRSVSDWRSYGELDKEP